MIKFIQTNAYTILAVLLVLFSLISVWVIATTCNEYDHYFEPKKEDVKIDIGLIKNKAEQWMRIIDGVIENASDEPLDEAKKIISNYYSYF